MQDGDRILLGSSDDLQIHHDGSNSIINDTGTGNLRLQTASTTRLECTSNGVTVTGEVTATSYVGDGSSLTGVGGENDITSCLFT